MLLDEIEYLRYYENESDIYWKINQIKSQLNHGDIYRLVDYFLLHLRYNHDLPGKVYVTLSGIGKWERDKKPLTDKQIFYVLASIASYWDELDLFK
jgi:hypothetical protein